MHQENIKRVKRKSNGLWQFECDRKGRQKVLCHRRDVTKRREGKPSVWDVICVSVEASIYTYFLQPQRQKHSNVLNFDSKSVDGEIVQLLIPNVKKLDYEFDNEIFADGDEKSAVAGSTAKLVFISPENIFLAKVLNHENCCRLLDSFSPYLFLPLLLAEATPFST